MNQKAAVHVNDDKVKSHYALLCPVVLPSSLPADATINGIPLHASYRTDECDNFNMTCVNRTLSTDIPNYVLYPESIGAAQYILGRDTLLEMSKFKKASSLCSSIQVLILPWYNPHNIKDNEAHSHGVNSWAPEINDLFIQCSANMIYRSLSEHSGVRMIVWARDIDYLNGVLSLSDLVVAAKHDGCEKLSLFIPNKQAQSNVEACQLFFHHSRDDNQIQLLAEKFASQLFCTCFLVQAQQLRFIKGPIKDFANITDAFVSKLKLRLDASDFRLFEPMSMSASGRNLVC